jgi:hypothetical protein
MSQRGWLTTNTFVAPNLTVYNSLTVASTLTVSGLASFSSLVITGTTSIADLDVSQLVVEGLTSTANLNVGVSSGVLASLAANFPSLGTNIVFGSSLTLCNGTTNFASLQLSDSYLTVKYTKDGNVYDYNLVPFN